MDILSKLNQTNHKRPVKKSDLKNTTKTDINYDQYCNKRGKKNTTEHDFFAPQPEHQQISDSISRTTTGMATWWN